MMHLMPVTYKKTKTNPEYYTTLPVGTAPQFLVELEEVTLHSFVSPGNYGNGSNEAFAIIIKANGDFATVPASSLKFETVGE